MNTFVNDSGMTAADVAGFKGTLDSTNTNLADNVAISKNVEKQLLEENRLAETKNIFSISGIRSLLSDNHFEVVDDAEYGSCIKYGHIVLYLSVKRAHIRFNNASFNAKDGLQYDNDEGGLNTQILSKNELSFLCNLEQVLLKSPRYVYINSQGEIASYCSNNANVSDIAPVDVKNTAWQTPE